MNAQFAKENVIVVGHKNPDTDSICSAIAYAYLKNHTDDKSYEAMRAGKLNQETKFVLNYFKQATPELCSDVQLQLKDVAYRVVDGIDENISLKDAWNIMRDEKIDSLAILNKKKLLSGLITVKSIANINMDIYDNKILGSAKTSYKNIIETIQGELIVGDKNAYIEKGKLLIGAANPDVLENYIDEGDIVILGNRYESQLCAIEMKAECIIVCSEDNISKTIQILAREKGCSIIKTNHDTYTIARLISQSPPVKYFMKTENLISFDMELPLEEARQVMASVRHRYFPLLAENGTYLGMMSTRNLLNSRRKEIILVDHNEKTQAVDGLDQADILEIIDHHRIGNLETLQPVFFRNQPLGCTATIISQMYFEKNTAIPKEIAGLLCAAIISDTLMFRSPTCTNVDRTMATELSIIAGIDIEDFSDKMFEEGSNMEGKNPEEIFYQDFKIFNVGELSFGVGQSNFMNKNAIKNAETLVKPYLEQALEKERVDMIFYLVTNVLSEQSNLLMYGGAAEAFCEKAFNKKVTDGTVLLDGLMSRKKQFLPPMMLAMRYP